MLVSPICSYTPAAAEGPWWQLDVQGRGGVDLLNLMFYKDNYFSTATS